MYIFRWSSCYRGQYVYQTGIDVASKKAPSGAVCFLLNCFFSNSELISSNLTGTNGKKQLIMSPQINDHHILMPLFVTSKCYLQM